MVLEKLVKKKFYVYFKRKKKLFILNIFVNGKVTFKTVAFFKTKFFQLFFLIYHNMSIK